MKLTNIHIAIIVVIFILIAINWNAIAKALKLPTGDEIKDSLTGKDTASAEAAEATSKALDYKLVLKKGSSGPEVQKLQTFLLMVDKNCLPKYGNDGDFGQETLSALQKYTGYTSITLNDAIDQINNKFKQMGSSVVIPKQ